MSKRREIFGGPDSRDMWDAIHQITAMSTDDDIHDVLYLIGCRLQQFETQVNADIDELAGRKLSRW